MKCCACVLFALVLSIGVASGQTNDRKVIFELKTKCMELAKQICREDGVGYNGSFYDAKNNRCYVLTMKVDSSSVVETLVDVHTGISLVWMYKSLTVNGISQATIGDSSVSVDRAEKYLARRIADWTK